MRILFLILVILALIVITGLLSWGSRHPAFAVEGVEVNGTKELSRIEVKEFAEVLLNEDKWRILSRKNIFLYPRKQIESGVLEAFPRAMTASVSLSSFREPVVVLNVKERVPSALWCNGLDCFLVDDSGFIFAEANELSLLKGFYVFEGGVVGDNPVGLTLLPNHFSRISKLMNEIESIGINVESMNIENDENYEIVGEDGMALRIKFAQTNEDVISNLRAIMGSSALREQDIEYIDLRFGNRVYYKLD